MSKLLSDPKWMVLFNKYVESIRDEGIVRRSFPKYEDYSYLARKLPFFLYDNDTFTSSIGCKTAFTTGDAIYFNKDFFIKLMEVDAKCLEIGRPDLANAVVMVILHELAHCLNDDFRRLVSLPPQLVSIAQDIANNLSLHFDLGVSIDIDIFEEITEVKPYGFTNEEYVEYGNMSSETIALSLYRAAVEKLKSQQGQQQGQQGQSSVSSPIQGAIEEAVEALKSPQSNSTSTDADDHLKDHNDVVEAAAKAGIDPTALARAGITPRTAEETAAINEMNKMRSRQSAIEMEADYNKLSESEKQSTSAGTQGSYYSRKVKIGETAKINWSIAISESFEAGSSMDMQYTEEVLVDEFYSNSSLYNGVSYSTDKKKGTGIFLIDTSGSMPAKFLDDAFSEALASVDLSGDDGFDSILIFPADTDVKNDYWELTPENKDQVVQDIMGYGGGGTDFTLPLQNALSKAYELDYLVQTVVFVTDLDAPPPRFSQIEESLEEDQHMPPVVFVTNKLVAQERESFEKACNGYAQVFYYEHGLELDIQEITEELESIRDQANYSASMGM